MIEKLSATAHGTPHHSGDHQHDHANHHAHGHHHGHNHAHHAPAVKTISALGGRAPTLLALSAGQRLIAVIPFIALLWLGVFWAMRGV